MVDMVVGPVGLILHLKTQFANTFSFSLKSAVVLNGGDLPQVTKTDDSGCGMKWSDRIV